MVGSMGGKDGYGPDGLNVGWKPIRLKLSLTLAVDSNSRVTWNLPSLPRHLDKVQVENQATGESAMFMCNK